MHAQTYKYKLLSLFLDVYVFSADHFVLDNILGWARLTLHLSAIISWLQFLFQVCDPHPWDFFSFALMHLLTLTLFRSCLCSYVYERQLYNRLPAILAFTIFPSLFYDVLWTTDARAVMWVYPVRLSSPWSIDLCIVSSWSFCDGLHLLQREVSLMRAGTALTCGYEDKI